MCGVLGPGVVTGRGAATIDSPMRIGIATKLFLALVAVSATVIVAMGVAAHASFTRGFLGYLNEQALQYIDAMRPRVAAAYKAHGSWEFLRDNPRQWIELVRGRPPMPEGVRRSRLPLSEPDLTGVPVRITLLDADRNFVIGNPEVTPSAPTYPIDVDGRVVGWLALVPFQQATEVAAIRFEQRYFTSTWIIVAIAITLAALISWGLSRLLVAPLKRITAATHRLASGDYTVRTPVGSRDEIGRLSEDFNRLAETLARNEQLRRSFMADISHELRTPLAILKGELEAIEDGVRPANAATLASLRTEIDKLGKLVNDLYDLSLADIGALSYRMVDVDANDVLRTTLESFEQRFAQRNLRLEDRVATEPALVSGDEARLQQLFTNLLENCARYTDAGGTVRVSSSLSADAVEIEIEDSGPGVPPEMLPRLFERLLRADASRSREHGGAGLGLAICRNIVEAHHGSIAALPAPLGGLLIRIRLPRLSASEMAA